MPKHVDWMGSDGAVAMHTGYFAIWSLDSDGNKRTCLLVVRDHELARELAIEYLARFGLSVGVIADYQGVGLTAGLSLN